MFSRTSVRLGEPLYEQAKSAAAAAGYSSVDELVVHLVERYLAETGTRELHPEVAKQLRGLGYLE